MGIPAQELLSRPFLEFVHPEDRAATLAEMKHIGCTSGITYFVRESLPLRATGRIIWLLWNATPSSDQKLILPWRATSRCANARNAAWPAGYAVTRVLADAETLDEASATDLEGHWRRAWLGAGRGLARGRRRQCAAVHRTLAPARALNFRSLSRPRENLHTTAASELPGRVWETDAAHMAGGCCRTRRIFRATLSRKPKDLHAAICVSDTHRRSRGGRDRIFQPRNPQARSRS